MAYRVVKKGELFATFNFDNKDCADMGVYSITSGAVYTLNIEPEFKDYTLEVPMYDGKYYYGTQITGQQFQFTCFCHDLLISEYDRLRAWLHPRKIGRLILSDQPYKYYLCKVVSISSLGAYPLTTIQTPQYHELASRIKGEVVYTGNFTVTFETVGSAYGYGLSYYRDDLIYDAKAAGYTDNYYYDSGLIYRDMAPRLKWDVEANADKQDIPMYNPGSAASAPKYKILHDGATFPAHSYIQIKNDTLGSTTTIDVSNLSGDVIIDTISQTLFDGDGKEYYGRFDGEAMLLSPYRDLITLPETWVENIEDTDLIEHVTFYLHKDGDNYIVDIHHPLIRVSNDWVGYYFCCNYNGGSEILSVDKANNTLTISGERFNQEIKTAEENDGIHPGIAYNYLELNGGTKPETADVNTVVIENGIWYVYTATQGWQKTNYFGSKDEFYDIYGNLQPVWKVYGATILDLDKVTITTGNNVKYLSNGEAVEAASMDSFTLEAELLPRYL